MEDTDAKERVRSRGKRVAGTGTKSTYPKGRVVKGPSTAKGTKGKIGPKLPGAVIGIRG